MHLGEVLVAELGLEESNDVLGRWMAHHVASLIEAARASEGEERRLAQDRCAEAVLELWRHRNCLPDGRRPFEAAEPLLKVIESLDPSGDRPFYQRSVWDHVDDRDGGEEGSRQWLTTARSVDRAARTLIQFLLARAAAESADKTQAWVVAAEAAGVGGIDVQALRRLILLHRELAPGRNSEAEGVRNRLAALHELEAVAGAVRRELEDRLREAEVEPEEDSEEK